MTVAESILRAVHQRQSRPSASTGAHLIRPRCDPQLAKLGGQLALCGPTFADQRLRARIPDRRKFLHPTLPASDTNRDCLPQGRVSSDRICNSELATSEVGPSRQMPMLGLYVSFRGIPDIERFSACAEPVAKTRSGQSAMFESCPKLRGELLGY
jgi:hypothetical protein